MTYEILVDDELIERKAYWGPWTKEAREIILYEFCKKHGLHTMKGLRIR